MASPLRYLARHPRVFSALMLAGACSLLGLTLIHALHHIGDQHCEGEITGDPFDCFLCNSLHHLAATQAIVFTLPTPQPGEVLQTAAPLTRPAVGLRRPGAARAPPPLA